MNGRFTLCATLRTQPKCYHVSQHFWCDVTHNGCPDPKIIARNNCTWNHGLSNSVRCFHWLDCHISHGEKQIFALQFDVTWGFWRQNSNDLIPQVADHKPLEETINFKCVCFRSWAKKSRNRKKFMHNVQLHNCTIHVWQMQVDSGKFAIKSLLISRVRGILSMSSTLFILQHFKMRSHYSHFISV